MEPWVASVLTHVGTGALGSLGTLVVIRAKYHYSQKQHEKTAKEKALEKAVRLQVQLRRLYEKRHKRKRSVSPEQIADLSSDLRSEISVSTELDLLNLLDEFIEIGENYGNDYEFTSRVDFEKSSSELAAALGDRLSKSRKP